VNQYGFSPGDLVTFFRWLDAWSFGSLPERVSDVRIYNMSPRGCGRLSFTVASEEYLNDVLCILELDGPWVKVVSRSCNGWIYYSYLQACK